jgi:hypothetical protein
MSLELILPKSVAPKFRCEVCGATFRPDEEPKWMRHVPVCAKKHRDGLEVLSEVNKARNPLNVAIDQEALDFQLRKYGNGR